MKIVQEFREFALRGNVIDLAVGVIIGAGFGKLVDSMVADLIMPGIARLTGGLDLSRWFLPLADIPPGTAPTLAAVRAAGVPVLAYGNFITVVVNFLILAWVIFMLVRTLNRLRHSQPPAAPATPEDTLLLREIRDNLRHPANTP